ncbi:hypothetical protein D3C85_1095150 [compost metagenome]
MPAAVEHEDDLLIAFILILPGNRGTLAGGGFPVDLAQAVAFTKFAQLMEFQAQAPSLFLAYAKLAEPVVHRQQLPSIQTGEIWVDAGGIGQVEQASVRPEPQGAWQVDFAVFEAEVAALERA